MNKGAIATSKCILTVKWRNHGHNSVSIIMKDYVIISNDRAPVRFTGELLASSSSNDDYIEYEFNNALEADAFAKEMSDKQETDGYPPTVKWLRLNLYRTRSGNLILDQVRINYDPTIESNAHFTRSLLTFDSFEKLIKDVSKQDGVTYGAYTHALLSNLSISNPEFAELWVEDID